MAIWEYLEEGSISKELVVVKTASRVAGQYGTTHVDDQVVPDRVATLRTTDGLTAAELTTLKNLALTKDGTTTVVDNAGTSHSGRIVGLTWQRLDGTDRYQATLTLRSQADE